MNISKSLLIVGLLVTGVAQATNFSPDELARINLLYQTSHNITEQAIAENKNACQGTFSPDACIASQTTAIVHSVKGSLKVQAKEAKDFYENTVFLSKDEKETAKRAYEVKKEAYHAYRKTWDKIFG